MPAAESLVAEVSADRSFVPGAIVRLPGIGDAG
jgi:hypothetical protein